MQHQICDSCETVVYCSAHGCIPLQPLDSTQLHYKAVVDSVQTLFKHKQPQQEPVPLRDAIVANLVREGINKHRARELAEHFYSLTSQQPAQPYNPEPDVRELSKWLNEEPNREINRPALARVLAYLQTHP